MRTIAAIETSYKGYRFRSRLEARWAVFFDALRLKWRYEWQGFWLPDGPYLPDFHLEGIGWVEVKPFAPSYHERRLCEQLCESTYEPVYLFSGEIGDELEGRGHDLWQRSDGGAVHSGQHYWCACETCGVVRPEFWQDAGRLCDCPGREGERGAGDLDRIRGAFWRARSARFEHGERGFVRVATRHQSPPVDRPHPEPSRSSTGSLRTCS